MIARILGCEDETDTHVPERDITSPSLADIGEVFDWVAARADVSRDSLVLRGREVWVGGACSVLAILDSGRWVGDAGEIRCGDWLREGARRLCGGCSDTPPYEGCGDRLEQIDG